MSSCHLFGGPFRGVTFGGSGVSIGGGDGALGETTSSLRGEKKNVQKKQKNRYIPPPPPPKFNSSPLKMDGWNTIVSFWDAPFSGAMIIFGRVPFRSTPPPRMPVSNEGSGWDYLPKM